VWQGSVHRAFRGESVDALAACEAAIAKAKGGGQ